MAQKDRDVKDTGKLEKELELLTTEDIPKNPQKLNIPQISEEEHYDFMQKVGKYWEYARPKSVLDYVARIVVPGYSLWILPNEMHEYLNKALFYATKISGVAGQEEIALGTGIAYAVSQTIYGLKNKSGKHVMSGLVGIIFQSKKLDRSKLTDENKSDLKNSVDAAEKVLEHLSKKSKESN
jgi:hypothetical protein